MILSLTASTMRLSVRKYSPMPPNSPRIVKNRIFSCIGVQHHAKYQKHRQKPEKPILRLHPEGIMAKGMAKHPQAVIKKTHTAAQKHRQQEKLCLCV